MATPGYPVGVSQAELTLAPRNKGPSTQHCSLCGELGTVLRVPGELEKARCHPCPQILHLSNEAEKPGRINSGCVRSV